MNYYQDFKRIEALPRREPLSLEQAQELVKVYDVYKTLDGTQSLYPQQAWALHELTLTVGEFNTLPVGMGKTLVGFLAASVLGKTRPLLVVPASLIKKTEKAVKNDSVHWRFPKPVIKSYSFFSQKKNRNALEEIAPDLIIMDEAHHAAGKRSARADRFKRFCKKHRDVPMVCMTGSALKKSCADLNNVSFLALKHMSPCPITFQLKEDFIYAVDGDMPWGRGLMVPPLLKKKQKNPREWFRRRFAETPGVVSIAHWGYELPSSLNVFRHHNSYVPCLEKIKDVMDNWVDPNGEDIFDPLARARYISQLSHGFYYKWMEEPPEVWLEARKAWKSYAYHVLRSRKLGDSEAEVAEMYDPDEYRRWKAVKHLFDPIRETVWLDRKPVELAVKWAEKNKGIVWTVHRAFGEACEEMGLPFFSTGRDPEGYDGPMCVSLKAHSEGKNLQKEHHKNLFTMLPSSSTLLEQAIGRTLRIGQPKEEVIVDVWASKGVHSAAFDYATRLARRLEETGGEKHRISLATIIDVREGVASKEAQKQIEQRALQLFESTEPKEGKEKQ